ncbi:MAG TPA: UDP-N-acetylglucosamine 1-carboxyvinyltransferase [bacterium (Candidatus Stahlbacteria)]|nr:UDP-N-acetylglucosamine 1-carboxyvinyltransferase [Candidatus Stahlbacteria bacterium]
MEKFVITGGVPLKGEVTISGAKNACLPIMAATLLAPGKTVLHNVPILKDVQTMANVLRVIGAKIYREDHTLIIDTESCDHPEAPYELVSTMRASFLVAGPLIARMGKAKISRPGGCTIGPRPIDEHLRGFKALGAEIFEEHGYVYCKVKSLKGSDIILNEQSVTATENIIMVATLAAGTTIIINGAKEPHVRALIDFLRKAGAKIYIDAEAIVVEGVKKLHPIEYTIPPDYIEADTFMIAAGLTKGDIFLRGASWEDSSSEIAKLEETGLEIRKDSNGIRAKGSKIIKSVDLKTAPYPGFPTDLQPQMCALLSIASGTSVVTETMYRNRFTHVPELQRMRANIKIDGRDAIIQGVTKLTGANVTASDIRAGASLLLAGLAADSQTEISRIYHIDRGYERIEEKIKGIGGKIERVYA